MASKSWPTKSAVQCLRSSRQLGCHTYPAIYAVEDYRLGGSKKTSKRNSEESLKRASKISTTCQSPSDCCSQAFSGQSSSKEPQSLKRKSTTDKSEEGLKKRSRGIPSPAEDHTQTLSGSSPNEDAGTSTPTIVSISSEAEESKSRTRKSEEIEGPRKRSKKTPSLFESPSQEATTEVSSSDKSGTSTSANTAPPDSRAAFEAKYEEKELLGEGGFGSVFAGQRKDDNLPVAIKHIPQIGIKHTSMLLDGKINMVPLEVALLLTVKPAAAGTSAAVSLLDWYDLDDELIIILERPVPCLDLTDYINSRRTTLQEHEAKTIAKQLVDALIELHSRGVFHRDIKLDNILIETGSDVPRVRLIDFGCGTFLSEGIYTTEQGTYVYTTPEWFLDGCYRAEPTTVWQLGVVLFGILHRYLPFRSSFEIVFGNPDVSDSLSFNCQDFLLKCLAKSPEARPTLDALKHHPWLI